ncbi:MAG: biotin-dependent carboxyltransferase family protein [Planctomycetota bacterium]
MSVLTVLDPGLLCTVQDTGRHGHASLGVAHAGAADTVALRIANRLVANRDDDAALEITLSAASFTASVDTRIAFAGAATRASIDTRDAYPLLATALRAGETLTIHAPPDGARTYLAIAGGVRTAPVMGSRSTHASTGFGSPHDGPLHAGDTLPITRRDRHPTVHADRIALIELLRARRSTTIRTIGGPRTACTVDPRSDRTGVRLLPDQPLPSSAPTDPEPVHPGAIQHTPDGALVALGPDAATTGGYPIVASIALVDLPVLAQLRPRDRCTLTPITIDEACALLRARERLLDNAIPSAPTPDA